LVRWRVKGVDELLSSALKTRAGKHKLAAAALELHLEQPSPKARELTALYASYGQPQALRSAALNAMDRLAKDDPALQDLIIPMIDDPDRSVRTQAWKLAGSLKVKKALPALEARLSKEGAGTTGFTGFGAFPPRRELESAINELMRAGAKTAADGAANPTKSQTDLEKQAENLENLAKELRKRIEALKPATK
jgi:hypothetical protein